MNGMSLFPWTNSIPLCGYTVPWVWNIPLYGRWVLSHSLVPDSSFLLGQTFPPFCLCTELPYVLKCVLIWHLFWKDRNGSSFTLERGTCSLTFCAGYRGDQFHERPGLPRDTDLPVTFFLPVRKALC